MGFKGDTGTGVRSRAVGAAVTFLRMALAFVLAFGTVLGAQSALAADALARDSRSAAAVSGAGDAGLPAAVQSDGEDDESSGASEPSGSSSSPNPSDSSSSSSSSPDPSSSSSSAATLYIADIGVFRTGTTTGAVAYASESGKSKNEVRATIDQRGGQIDFDGAIQWDDGSAWEYESNKVKWSIDEAGAAIARISQSGILEAKGTDDGMVVVTASVDGSYTADGKPLAAIFKVELRGQTDTKYVTAIAICDDKGAPIDPSYRFAEGALSTAMVELQAKVSVMDPATGASTDYQVTSTSGLSAQTSGELSDLLWESADTRLGTVSEEGVYRPVVTGTNIVYAYSNAGFNGTRVTAQAVIDMPAASGEEVVKDYHPQSTLTVKVFYQKYPDQQVGERVFSVDDLESLGTVSQVYTALGGGGNGFMTWSGRGPLLATVLEAAGVNIDGVADFKLGSSDNYQQVASWDMLVDTNRYYFPNIDVGSFADGVQVAPMIAIDAHLERSTDVSPHYGDMDDHYRFTLLFGAKSTGETTTNLQVYNIHTLYVYLAGSPAAKSGKYAVKFIDSITGQTLKSVETEDPDSVKAPTVPAHDGYVFKGWSRSVDASGNVTFTTIYEKEKKKKDADKEKDKDKNSGTKDSGEDSGEGDSDDSADEGHQGGGENGIVPANDGGNDAGAGQGAYDLVNANQTGAGSDAGRAKAADVAQSNVIELAPQDLTTINAGRWSMLQAINKHPSNVDELMADNPFAPYAAPVTAGVFAAGGVEAFARFAWQKRKPKLSR